MYTIHDALKCFLLLRGEVPELVKRYCLIFNKDRLGKSFFAHCCKVTGLNKSYNSVSYVWNYVAECVLNKT